MEDSNLICIPGMRLSLSDKEHVSGNGTYERHGYIYSTFAGVVNIVKDKKVSIVQVHSSNDQSIVPSPGNIVTAMVTMIYQRYCKCVIKCIGDVVLSRTYRAILRKEDVRATEKDRVNIAQCFRPGDIILARVMPMTDIHCYQLSTAENELGVVIVMSKAGVAMVPISWTEMQCPKTLVKTCRKVAKVVPEESVKE